MEKKNKLFFCSIHQSWKFSFLDSFLTLAFLSRFVCDTFFNSSLAMWGSEDLNRKMLSKIVKKPLKKFILEFQLPKPGTYVSTKRAFYLSDHQLPCKKETFN